MRPFNSSYWILELKVGDKTYFVTFNSSYWILSHTKATRASVTPLLSILLIGFKPKKKREKMLSDIFQFFLLDSLMNIRRLDQLGSLQ